MHYTEKRVACLLQPDASRDGINNIMSAEGNGMTLNNRWRIKNSYLTKQINNKKFNLQKNIYKI